MCTGSQPLLSQINTKPNATTYKTVVFCVDSLTVVEGFTECGGLLVVAGVRVQN
jgi:hypothetical protein